MYVYIYIFIYNIYIDIFIYVFIYNIYIDIYIIYILYVFKLVNGMVLSKRSITHLDHLLQKKLLRYQDHKQNYIWSIHEGIISNGLQLSNPSIPCI